MLTRRRLLKTAAASLALAPLHCIGDRPAKADGYDTATELAWHNATGYWGQDWLDTLNALQFDVLNATLGGADALARMPPPVPANVVPPPDAITYEEFWQACWNVFSLRQFFMAPMPIWGGGGA